MVLVVGGDQGEGHRGVAQGIRGQEQRKAAQVQFIDAECAAELLQDLAAMLGHVEFSARSTEHVVDEPRGRNRTGTRGGATPTSAPGSCRP